VGAGIGIAGGCLIAHAEVGSVHTADALGAEPDGRPLAAGGLGFIAAGLLPADAFAERIVAARKLTSGPLGVNLFVPQPSAGTPATFKGYAAALAAEAEHYGVRLGKPRYDDDDWAAKLDVVHKLRPDVVSFTFGLPTMGGCSRLETPASRRSLR
jgi:nitronate monooxygenase